MKETLVDLLMAILLISFGYRGFKLVESRDIKEIVRNGIMCLIQLQIIIFMAQGIGGK